VLVAWYIPYAVALGSGSVFKQFVIFYAMLIIYASPISVEAKEIGEVCKQANHTKDV